MSNIHISRGVLHIGFSLDGEKKCLEFCSSISGSSGVFLVWLYCLWMVRWCSVCQCYRRWCQRTLVVVQLASWAGYQASSALRLCVPHVWHTLPLCWPASSEVEAAFLTSNLRCSFILSLPASVWFQWSETSLDSFIKSFTSPFFTPSPQSCNLGFNICCMVCGQHTWSLPWQDHCILSYLYFQIIIGSGGVDVVAGFVLNWLLPAGSGFAAELGIWLMCREKIRQWSLIPSSFQTHWIWNEAL